MAKRSSRSSSASTGAVAKTDEVKVGSESKVFLIKKSLVTESASNLEIMNMTHPRTNSAAKFLIYEKQLFEISTFQERFRSWFIGQSVAANGNVYMTTSFDPLFLALPFLTAECSDRAVPIDQLFVDSETVRNGRLLEVLEDEQLELVADVKRSGDIKALKYNADKTLDWLVRKCEKLIPTLIENKIHCGSSATSANFVKSEKLETEKESKEDMLRYAYFIVADYVTEDLGQQLLKRLGIEIKSEASNAAKQKPTATMKRSISGDDDDLASEKPSAKKVAAEVKVSSKTKAMAKAASGTKSISSFFSKKA